MDFVGTGRRLTSAGLMAAANKVGVDPATLRAVLEVETAGAGFDAKNRLKLLFEPHIFYKQLGPGPKRDEYQGGIGPQGVGWSWQGCSGASIG